MSGLREGGSIRQQAGSVSQAFPQPFPSLPGSTWVGPTGVNLR